MHLHCRSGQTRRKCSGRARSWRRRGFRLKKTFPGRQSPGGGSSRSWWRISKWVMQQLKFPSFLCRQMWLLVVCITVQYPANAMFLFQSLMHTLPCRRGSLSGGASWSLTNWLWTTTLISTTTWRGGSRNYHTRQDKMRENGPFESFAGSSFKF